MSKSIDSCTERGNQSLSGGIKIQHKENSTGPLCCYKPVRSLRSSDRLLLQVPNVSTATYGQMVFSFCAPKLWNTVPQTIKQTETEAILKRNLKHFFYRFKP